MGRNQETGIRNQEEWGRRQAIGRRGGSKVQSPKSAEGTIFLKPEAWTSCQLSVVSCQLSVVSCQLSVVS